MLQVQLVSKIELLLTLTLLVPLPLMKIYRLVLTLAEFNASDPDGRLLTYHLVDENGSTMNNLFTLDQNGTETAVLFDYESNASTYLDPGTGWRRAQCLI